MIFEKLIFPMLQPSTLMSITVFRLKIPERKTARFCKHSSTCFLRREARFIFLRANMNLPGTGHSFWVRIVSKCVPMFRSSWPEKVLFSCLWAIPNTAWICFTLMIIWMPARPSIWKTADLSGLSSMLRKLPVFGRLQCHRYVLR